MPFYNKVIHDSCLQVFKMIYNFIAGLTVVQTQKPEIFLEPISVLACQRQDLQAVLKQDIEKK